MRFTISIPDDLVSEIKRVAKEQGATYSSVVAQAMAIYLTLQKITPGAMKDVQKTVQPNQQQLFKQLKEFKG